MRFGLGLAALVALLLLLGACGGGEAAPTPKPVSEGAAVQIFVREAQKVGWFQASDEVELTSEPLEWEEALAAAQELRLALYRTMPGTPPFTEALDGYFITAEGEFYDVPAGATPSPEFERRPAVAAAFVDRQGGLTYSMRFTDVPAPTGTPIGD